jgi:hypothetical protein
LLFLKIEKLRFKVLWETGWDKLLCSYKGDTSWVSKLLDYMTLIMKGVGTVPQPSNQQQLQDRRVHCFHLLTIFFIQN